MLYPYLSVPGFQGSSYPLRFGQNTQGEKPASAEAAAASPTAMPAPVAVTPPQAESTGQVSVPAEPAQASAPAAASAKQPKPPTPFSNREIQRKFRLAKDYLDWWLDKGYLKPVPLEQQEFTVLDLETTGLKRSDKDIRIIEIAAIKYRNGVETARFTALVNPHVPIPEVVQQMTHITDAMASQGLETGEALEALARFVGPNPTLVAHNAAFDLPFIRSKMHQNNLDHWKDRFDLKRAVCTQTLSRIALPQLEGYPEKGKGVYKLETLAPYLGFKNPGAHRAGNDVETTSKVLYELIKRLRAGEAKTGNAMKTILDLFAYQGPAVAMYGASKPVPMEADGPWTLLDRVKRVLSEVKKS